MFIVQGSVLDLISSREGSVNMSEMQSLRNYGRYKATDGIA